VRRQPGAAQPGTGQPGIAVGARIRALRTERGLSLSALAAAAGIGKGSLSELESGRRNPTLDTLYAVAGPLGVPLAMLVDFREGVVVADAGFETVLLHTERAATTTSEVWLLRVDAGVTRSSPAHQPGVVEQLVVLAGSCRVEYGEQSVDVAAGGHAVWPADVPHRYTAGEDSDLRAVNVIVTPS
jgi:transcriptional regulator with XRE-family HTH domain